jgi:hypothetical protein
MALSLLGAAASGLLLGLRPPSPARVSVPPRMMPNSGSYEEYAKDRNTGAVQGGSIDETQEALKEWEKYADMDFDGGDSGGGVVGDGNTDLEDQHNSPSIVRGGMGSAEVGEGGMNVGRGQVKSATTSRTASAGKNYFGRSTGYAEKRIAEISESDLKNHKMDCVRAQQLENWHNQRNIAKENRAQGQGVVFGEKKQAGHYIAREALAAGRGASTDGEEISQKDLAKHLESLSTTATERLDGGAWEEVTAEDDEEVTETIELKAPVGGVEIHTLKVKNQFNTFAPYQCKFTADSPIEFSASPNEGSMNRRTGDPIEVTVRFNPKSYGEPVVGKLVFETEDFKNVYKFIGST